MTRFGLTAALAGVVLAGGLMVSGVAYAQSNAYAQSSSKDPAACTATCQKERSSCLAQMGTPEMCGVDYKVCTRQCDSK